MRETGATFSHFLPRRKAAMDPALITSCLLVMEDSNQAMIGWMAATFLVFMA